MVEKSIITSISSTQKKYFFNKNAKEKLCICNNIENFDASPKYIFTLIVGHTGFLGREITTVIDNAACMARTSGLYKCDISLCVPKFTHKFKTVVCVAGKAHSNPKTSDEKQEFFHVNYEGVKNLIQGLETSNSIPEQFVFISTVAVYGLDQGENITENQPRNGNSPYALSKIMAEDFLIEWAEKRDVILTILRLPLVAGANPPGNLGKMIQGIRRGRYISLGGGKARKSVVLAKDVAEFIPKIAAVGGIYNLTDGVHPTFREIEDVIKRQVERTFVPSCPVALAKLFGKVGDAMGQSFPVNSNLVSKMTSSLTFSDQRARDTGLWRPRSVVENFHI
jgi:nucleoside-diphosphate-sugar epimerase